MLKTMLGAIGLVMALVTATTAPAQTMFRPVAVVNDSAITGFDLAQRAQILVALGFPTASVDALRTEALNRLIDDRLKLREAKRSGLSPTPEAIAEGIDLLARTGGVSADEFQAMLGAQGVSRQALEDMVAADILWRQLVRNRFLRRIEPGEAEIDAEIALMQQRAGVSYRLMQIGLPKNDAGRSEAETEALAEKLYRSLSEGGDFAAAVRKYSRAPSAARGGEIGWISSLRLPPRIAEALEGLEPGQVTRPVQGPGGFSILKLVERRVDSADDLDPANPDLREQVRDRLISQQTARLAEGLLQELRRDALIEIR